MERWVGRVALVTGVSAGIGAGIAELLVREGMIVVGCARRLDKVQELSSSLSGAKGHLHPIKCDVAKEEEILAMFEEIKTKYGGVDVCINNAGVGPPRAELLTGETASWKYMLDINILGLSVCTREAFKSMNERNVDDGQIINISSIAGHTVPMPALAHFYGCTKFAVRALTEGVRKELRELKSHIRIAEISPGVVESEMYGLVMGEEAAKGYLSSFEPLKAKDISDSVVYILSAPPHVQINVVGLSICTREAFKSMKDRGIDDGQIINISSVAGHVVYTQAIRHFYACTKFAVRALTEGVRKELRELKYHIRIAEISPGATESEILGLQIGEENAKPILSSFETMKAKDIADSVVYILSAPPHVQVHDIILAPTNRVY